MRFKRFHGAFVFLISMLIGFAVLGGLMLAFISYTKTHVADIKEENIPYISEHRPSKEESMSLLLLGCEKAESEPALSLLIKYDAPKGILTAVICPSATVATKNSGRTDSIKGHYSYEGIGGSVEAASALFETDIDRYIRVQKTGIANMVDFFGGVPFDVKSGIRNESETILKGEQLLDGRRFCSLIFHEPKAGVQNTAVQAELLKALLNRGLSKELADKYDALSSAIFYNFETNINHHDFAKRKTGFLNLLKLDSLVIRTYELKGIYKNGYELFIPNAQSLKQIKEALE